MSDKTTNKKEVNDDANKDGEYRLTAFEIRCTMLQIAYELERCNAYFHYYFPFELKQNSAE